MKVVSIHPMLMFIGIFKPFRNRCTGFNTSYVNVYHKLASFSRFSFFVSIHPMLMFINANGINDYEGT